MLGECSVNFLNFESRVGTAYNCGKMPPVTRMKRKSVIVISDSSDSENGDEAEPSVKVSPAKNRRIDEASQRAAIAAKKSKSSTPHTKNTISTKPSTSAHTSHVPTQPNITKRNGPTMRSLWNISDLLAERENVEPSTAQNIVNLFEQENTIPFICRYRRDLVHQITPERLREIKNTYSEILSLRKRAETIVGNLKKDNVRDKGVHEQILSAKTPEELEFLSAPYKQAKEGSLVERAKALGLESYADAILYGKRPAVKLHTIVDAKNPKLNNTDKVIEGICNIISHNVSKNTDILEKMRQLQKTHCIMIKSKEVVSTGSKGKNPTENSTKQVDASKFLDYFKFEQDVRHIKPHQILAINRGEKLKHLSVTIQVSDTMKANLIDYMQRKFLQVGIEYDLRYHIIGKAMNDCYTKKLRPLLARQIRSDLNALAKKSSIEMFAKNLNQLLLMSPLKGERILGIDPGFWNGCKYALISETGDVLETGVLYPHRKTEDPEKVGEKLAKLLIRNNCNIIALGNGKGCRETEHWLTKLFALGLLDATTVKYSIVSEQGASIYSCSEMARKEFPDKDINEISAISIARRLLDPLSEYVKIEPRHIGVGMYQHDVNDKLLTESLNEVVSECVSYVGVDINTASVSVLKHVAGLTEKKAEQIINFRSNNGSFNSRKELLKVKTIGEKTFQQCAGFIRIEPRSLNGNVENLLDCTWVHPESYDIAKKILQHSRLREEDIGKPHFIEKMREFVKKTDVTKLAANFNIPNERLEIVLIALQRELFQDYRFDIHRTPLFKKGITRMQDLEIGHSMQGAVQNVTSFGVFVDIGVECNGLLHVSAMMGEDLAVGDRITVIVRSVDIKRKRINLGLISIDT